MPNPRDYQEDLAYIHHAGFTQFITNACPGLLQILKSARIEKGLLVDLACGSGIWACAAQRAGFDVLGIDPSPAMIRLARGIAPRAQFRRGSLYHAKLPRCCAITCIGEGFTYFNPAKPNPTLFQLFRRLAAALAPGGILIFDLIVTGTPPLDKRNWSAGRDWAVLYDTREFPSSQLLVREMTTFRKLGARYRRGHEAHHVRIFRPAEVARALRHARFTFRTVRKFGKMKLYPRRLAFICKKP